VTPHPGHDDIWVLKQMLLALASTTGTAQHEDDVEFCELRDSSGATPTLGLLVANSEEATEVALEFYRNVPVTLLQQHSVGSPFAGEMAMHVLAVNQREDTLMAVIRLAHQNFDESQLRILYTTTAHGAFFSAEPMIFYGGTVLSYLVAFGMKKPLTLILAQTLKSIAAANVIDLNSTSLTCPFTGFFPQHVAVANGLTQMFAYLEDLASIAELEHLRADTALRSQRGRCREFCGMTPLQLATMLGDKRVTEFILQRKAKVLWKWGPITQYVVSLDGIDSLDSGSVPMLDMIRRPGARRTTQEMILDDFFDGLIFNVFQEKWRLFGRAYFITMRVVDLMFMSTLLFLIIELKCGVDERHRRRVTTVCPMVIISGLVIAMEDVRALWSLLHGAVTNALERVTKIDFDGDGDVGVEAQSELLRAEREQEEKTGLSRKDTGAHGRKGTGDHVGELVTTLREVAGTASRMRIFSKWAAILAAIVPCWLLLRSEDIDYHMLWVPFSFSFLISGSTLLGLLFSPHEKLGVLHISTEHMLRTDVSEFLCLFLGNFTMQGTALYICFPSYARQPPSLLVPSFDSFPNAMQSLLELALFGNAPRVFLGGPTEFNYPIMDAAGAVDMPQSFDFIFFVMIYFYVTIVLTILLLNLLIAMMGATYSRIYEDARLQWRIQFAQKLERLELLTKFLSKPSRLWTPWEQHAGTKIADGVYVFEFKNIQANAEVQEEREQGAAAHLLRTGRDEKSAVVVQQENIELAKLVQDEIRHQDTASRTIQANQRKHALERLRDLESEEAEAPPSPASPAPPAAVRLYSVVAPMLHKARQTGETFKGCKFLRAVTWRATSSTTGSTTAIGWARAISSASGSGRYFRSRMRISSPPVLPSEDRNGAPTPTADPDIPKAT